MPNKKNEKWFDPEVVNTGWDKDMEPAPRRMLMLKAHGGDNLAAGRAMQALSNVTQDKETKEESARDAVYFLKAHSAGRQHYPVTKRAPRITNKMPRLR